MPDKKGAKKKKELLSRHIKRFIMRKGVGSFSTLGRRDLVRNDGAWLFLDIVFGGGVFFHI